MILANLRKRLTPVDIDFVVAVLSRGDKTRHAYLARVVEDEGVEHLLDDPELFGLLCGSPELGLPSPELFTCVAVRTTLRQAGVDDQRLSDYVGTMLYEFGLRDRAHRIARHDDEVYRYVADIVADLESESGPRRFFLEAHLGNFTLWLAGVFPDHITARATRKGGPSFSYFEEMGVRGYKLAANNRLAKDYDLAETFELAADAFRRVRLALNRLSDRVFFPHVSTPERLLRQVHDEFVTDYSP